MCSEIPKEDYFQFMSYFGMLEYGIKWMNGGQYPKDYTFPEDRKMEVYRLWKAHQEGHGGYIEPFDALAVVGMHPKQQAENKYYTPDN